MPFLTAHMHRSDKPGDADKSNQLPKDPIPLSTADLLKEEMPQIVDDSLNRILTDKFRRSMGQQ